MTAFAASQLQQAVFSLLKADGALSGRVTGIYDEPPADARPPYVAFGEGQVADASVKDRAGATIRFDVQVWSGEASQMDAKEIMALVDQVLGGSTPPVPGFDVTEIRLQSATVVRQFSESGSLYRGRLSYSARVFKAA
ncbi:MAG: DUF3168 domain-containing protein [Alphaproteobacteria bacterium]|nr:DUF3168 domain-containing protein [Alphaproteobacteria bacterium]